MDRQAHRSLLRTARTLLALPLAMAGCFGGGTVGRAPAPIGADLAPPPKWEPGIVRVHIETTEPDVWLVSKAPGRGVWTVCRAPCGAYFDGRLGEELYLDGARISRSDTFQVGSRSGDLTVQVDPGSADLRGLGAGMTVVGVVLALVTVVPLSLAASSDSEGHGGTSRGTAALGAFFGVSLASVAIGIPLLLSSRTRYQLR